MRELLTNFAMVHKKSLVKIRPVSLLNCDVSICIWFVENYASNNCLKSVSFILVCEAESLSGTLFNYSILYSPFLVVI